MKRLTLRLESNEYFDEVWSLYENAFPAFMRRFRKDQLKVMEHPLYYCDVILNDDKFIGFIFWWDFLSCRYVEYFAIAENQQNKGWGSTVLKAFIPESEKPIILEVELPEKPIDRQRIKFYERIGFITNTYKYVLPPMREGEKELELLLMTYPHVFPKKEVEDFIDNCHPIIIGAY